MAKYVEIARELSRRIQSEVYRPNTYLPSESDLQQEFDASRDTIRKSLNLLAERKKIIKEKGKGSRILPSEMVTFPSSGLTSFKELASLSTQTITTDVIAVEETSSPSILRKLGISAGHKAIEVVRIRSYDGDRVILDRSYLNPEIITGITPEIASDSLYAHIENTLHLTISFARKEITVEPVSDRERDLLDLDDSGLLVVVRSFSYLEDGTLFEYSESRHRPDKFKFLDFSRRERL